MPPKRKGKASNKDHDGKTNHNHEDQLECQGPPAYANLSPTVPVNVNVTLNPQQLTPLLQLEQQPIYQQPQQPIYQQLQQPNYQQPQQLNYQQPQQPNYQQPQQPNYQQPQQPNYQQPQQPNYQQPQQPINQQPQQPNYQQPQQLNYQQPQQPIYQQPQQPNYQQPQQPNYQQPQQPNYQQPQQPNYQQPQQPNYQQPQQLNYQQPQQPNYQQPQQLNYQQPQQPNCNQPSQPEGKREGYNRQPPNSGRDGRLVPQPQTLSFDSPPSYEDSLPPPRHPPNSRQYWHDTSNSGMPPPYQGSIDDLFMRNYQTDLPSLIGAFTQQRTETAYTGVQEIPGRGKRGGNGSHRGMGNSKAKGSAGGSGTGTPQPKTLKASSSKEKLPINDQTEDGKNKQNKKKNNKNKSANHPIALDKKLYVTLSINSTFEDFEALKSTVMKELNVSENDRIELEFTTTSLLLRDNWANCNFVLLTNNISQAQACTKRMVANLRKKLKTLVSFGMNDDGKESVKNDVGSEKEDTKNDAGSGKGDAKNGAGSGKGDTKNGACSGKGDAKNGAGSGKGDAKNGAGSGKGDAKNGAGSGKGDAKNGAGSGKGDTKNGAGSGKGDAKNGAGSGKGDAKNGAGSGKGDTKNGAGSGKGDTKNDAGSGKGDAKNGAGSGKGDTKNGACSGKGDAKNGAGSGKGDTKNGAGSGKGDAKNVAGSGKGDTQNNAGSGKGDAKNGAGKNKKSKKSGKDQNDKRENVKETEKGEVVLHPQLTQSSPVTLCVTMVKTFAQTEGFVHFVSTLINGYSNIEDFRIENNTVVLSETESQCDVYLHSKADAKRLRKTLVKFEKEAKLVIKCVNKNEKNADDNDPNKMAIWNSRVEKISVKMKEKRDTILKNHDKKMESLRTRLGKMASDSNRIDESNVVEDKLKEASRQKIEFLSRFTHLIDDLKNTNPSQSQMDDELNKMQKELGIEFERLVKCLPIYALREDIVSLVKTNQVSIILGESGSGKSTQLVQYLYQAGYGEHGLIVCTQSGNVAAMRQAERVALEMATKTGDLVGFKGGATNKMSDQTKLVFMTHQTLLNECLESRNFERYSCIIVDEANERTFYADVLLGMVKACLSKRPELRVVISSATIDPEDFVNYFECLKVLRVSGLTFPVEVIFTASSEDDFENHEVKAVAKAADIHRNNPEGDILVFLSSSVEVMKCCDEFNKMFKDRKDFKCLPLHVHLLPDIQRQVFATMKKGVRKIVFATNCAETSITIEGIRYVIDTGVKQGAVHTISQSCADQRKGRAGRTSNGICYRLFSEEGYNKMQPTSKSKILQIHLAKVILKLAEFGLDFSDFSFVNTPTESDMSAALETLNYIGALVDRKITDCGRWIVKLPFDPKMGYLVFEASKIDLLYDAVVLATVVSNISNLFDKLPTEAGDQASVGSGDEIEPETDDGCIAWYTIYKEWDMLQRQEQAKWWHDKFINSKCLSMVKRIVGEVVSLISREITNKNFKKRFSDADSALSDLSQLILRCKTIP